jgi:hypothetical protein
MRKCGKTLLSVASADGNIIRRMRFACWIHKATNAHSEYVLLVAFYCISGHAIAPQYYVTLTLAVLLNFAYHNKLVSGSLIIL